MAAQKLRRKIRRTAVRFLTAGRDLYIARMSALSDKVQSHAIQPCSVPGLYSFCCSREDRMGLIVREGTHYHGGGSIGGGVLCQDVIQKGCGKKYPVRKLTRRLQRGPQGLQSTSEVRMRRAEKRKKFHDALLKSLYPQSPEPNVDTGDDELPASTPAEEFDVNLIPDDYGLQMSGPSSSTSDTDGGSRKLSRAQRKRLRKKKIKEDACRRKGIIGPLLPPTADGEAECSPGVRQNADESGQGSNDAGVAASRMNQRRKAKKLAKEKLKPDLIKVSADDEKC